MISYSKLSYPTPTLRLVMQCCNICMRKYTRHTLCCIPFHQTLIPLSFSQQIMVPMLRGGHWSLYVVNTVRRCVDILDSNPYGPALGGTTWRTYHNAQVVDTNGVKLPWSRLIMNRLNKTLQIARPKSSIPKFGNYKIELAPNCPTMNPGSNDCGFFCYKIHTVLWFHGCFHIAILRSGIVLYISSAIL